MTSEEINSSRFSSNHFCCVMDTHKTVQALVLIAIMDGMLKTWAIIRLSLHLRRDGDRECKSGRVQIDLENMEL